MKIVTDIRKYEPFCGSWYIYEQLGEDHTVMKGTHMKSSMAMNTV